MEIVKTEANESEKGKSTAVEVDVEVDGDLEMLAIDLDMGVDELIIAAIQSALCDKKVKQV